MKTASTSQNTASLRPKLPNWVRGAAFPVIALKSDGSDLTGRSNLHGQTTLALFEENICYHACADPRAVAIMQEAHVLLDARCFCVWCGASSPLYVKQNHISALTRLQGAGVCPKCLARVCEKAQEARCLEELEFRSDLN